MSYEFTKSTSTKYMYILKRYTYLPPEFCLGGTVLSRTKDIEKGKKEKSESVSCRYLSGFAKSIDKKCR